MATFKCEIQCCQPSSPCCRFVPRTYSSCTGKFATFDQHVPCPPPLSPWQLAFNYFYGFNIFSYLCPTVWEHDPSLIHHCASVYCLSQFLWVRNSGRTRLRRSDASNQLQRVAGVEMVKNWSSWDRLGISLSPCGLRNLFVVTHSMLTQDSCTVYMVVGFHQSYYTDRKWQAEVMVFL